MKFSELITQVISYWKNGKVKQALLLFSVNIASIPIGILISVVLSRYLGSNGYGDYQFLENVFALAILIFNGGFFYAANRALVLNNDKEKAKAYYGATLIILLGLFLVMSIVLSLYALIDDNLREKNLTRIVLMSIPFGLVYLTTNYFETLFQADNRIRLLATARLVPKIGMLIGVGIIYYFFIHTTHDHLTIAWGLYILIQAVSAIYILLKIDMSFKDLNATIKEIWAFNRSYGFNVYTGAVFSVGVGTLTGLLISYFGENNSGVGFYALATTLANPLQFIPNTIATTNYKEFSLQTSIPKKLTKLTVLLTAIALIALWVVVPPFIAVFYSDNFRPVIYLNFIVSIGIACYGMGDFYNRYLGANGHGKSLRNASFIVGTIILALNLILIPLYGATGAAVTRLIGGLSYLLSMLYYYNNITGKTSALIEN